MTPANLSTEELSHVFSLDQVLWAGKSRAKDGDDTSSSLGVRVPGGGGVTHLLNWPDLEVGEVNLLILRGAVKDRALPS